MDDTKPVPAELNKPRFNLANFFRETRREISKVTWPTRKETVQMTAAIVCMALIVGLFFFAVDSILGMAVGRILGMKE